MRCRDSRGSQELLAVGKELLQTCSQKRLHKTVPRSLYLVLGHSELTAGVFWIQVNLSPCGSARRGACHPHSCWYHSPQTVSTFMWGRINTNSPNSAIRTDNCILLIVFFFQLRFTLMGAGKISPQAM